MIIFKKFGETIKIRNNHWKSLRARFNPENATLDILRGCYVIRRTCLLCGTYEGCNGCPFDDFGITGCISFFARIFLNGWGFESGDTYEVTWDKDKDKKAREQLNRLQRMMDKIEASQGEKDDTK